MDGQFGALVSRLGSSQARATKQVADLSATCLRRVPLEILAAV